MSLRRRYVELVKRNCTEPTDDEQGLLFWRNEVFSSTIIYLLPLCLIAAVPGTYWIYKNIGDAIAAVYVILLSCIFGIVFVPGVKPFTRKIYLISSAYLIGIVLLYFTGLSGPGLIYLLGSGFFSVLIFTTTYLYWPAWLNSIISIIFVLLVSFNMLPQNVLDANDVWDWIAVSANLIFLSFLSVTQIPRLFSGLQLAIENEKMLKNELACEKAALIDSASALQTVLDQKKKTLDSSLDVICKVSADGKFIEVSKACEEVWGYTAEELIGKRNIDFVCPEDRAKTLETAEKVRSGINAVDFENRYVHKNGSLVPISWSVRWDENEQVRYGIARNITEKKKLEQKLELEKQRFFDLFREAPIGMGFLSGPEFIYAIANPPFLQFIGNQDIIGKSVNDVWPLLIKQDFMGILHSVYTTGESLNVKEKHIQLKIDGILIDKHINLSLQAHRTTENEINGIFFFVADVTEQVISRKKIEVSESRLKDAQNISRMGNWEMDLINGTHFWSDEIYDLFGVEKGALISSTNDFIDLVHPDDRDYVSQKISEGLKSLENISFYFKFVRRDGSMHHAFNQWKFFFDKEGNPIILSGIIQDVTYQKEAEAQLKRAAQDLIQRNKDLEQFTYIVSHNLRTPVANIQGLLSIQNSSSLNEHEKAEIGSAFIESVNKLDEVVRDLNQILTLRDGLVEKNEEIIFAELVENIKVSIRNMLDIHEIEIHYDFREVSRIVTFKSYLYSIFYNLITNSIKYRKPELPCLIRIKTQLVDGRIQLSFSDNGLGMDLEKRGEQIFGLYKRFHSHVDGKGLGLFMVKAQVEKLGGTITVQSEVDKGTDFKIVI